MIKPDEGSDSNGSSRDGAPDSKGHAHVGPGHEPGLLARFKEFRATSVAVDHQTSVLFLLTFITVAGLLAYRAIPRESFPEVEIPMIAVNTVYPGVTPADIESLITRPLEDELSTISDVEDLTSTSVEGYSSIVAEFEATVDIEGALQKVREKGRSGEGRIAGRSRGPVDHRVRFLRDSHHAGEPLGPIRPRAAQGTRGGNAGTGSSRSRGC